MTRMNALTDAFVLEHVQELLNALVPRLQRLLLRLYPEL